MAMRDRRASANRVGLSGPSNTTLALRLSKSVTVGFTAGAGALPRGDGDEVPGAGGVAAAPVGFDALARTLADGHSRPFAATIAASGRAGSTRSVYDSPGFTGNTQPRR